MYYDSSEFPFTALLESSWKDVREELDRLTLAPFKPWFEKDLYVNNMWMVYGLYAMGGKLKDNCKACPKTVAVLEQIPDLVTAGFSALLPGTHIKPHYGYTGAVLRCHLGLSVPEPEKCALKVDGVEKRWQEGKSFVFNDMMLHEAWNQGSTPRVVLLLDFKNKKHPLPLAKKIEFAVATSVVRLVLPWVHRPSKPAKSSVHVS